MSKVYVNAVEPEGASTVLTLGTSGDTVNIGGTAGTGFPSGLFSGYAILEDQKTSGTGGGTATSGSWETRDLQTIVYNGIGLTLATNAFTLAAGNYLITWSAPAWSVERHQSRLYDVTGTAAVAQGSSIITPGSTVTYRADTTISIGSARVTPSSSNAYRIEHQVSSTHATNGYGAAASFGIEVYTTVKIFKES